MSKAKQKGAGRPTGSVPGNVTIDLGETIEKKLRAAGLRTEMAGKSAPSPAARQGGALGDYRPTGSFGGYRPWYSRFGRPNMGQGGEVTTTRTFTLIPASLQTLKTSDVLTGLGLGLVGNRIMVRVTPALWANDSKLLHEGLAFVASLIPMLFKRNAMTFSVAVPGAVILGATLLDKLFDAVGVPQSRALRGGEGAPRADAASAARQKLAAIQQRINLAQAQPQPQQQAARPHIPRVVAQPSLA